MPEYFDTFLKWLHYKRKRRESYKDEDSTFLAYKKLVRLANNDPTYALEIVEHSMGNNYAGLFEPPENNKQRSTNRTGIGRHVMTTMIRPDDEVRDNRHLKN